MERAYRPCVVAVIRGAEGRVLAGERSDRAGAWQLPQGGIDSGESPETALLRELREEIGTDALRIIKKADAWIRYDFPRDVGRDIMKAFAGQEQMWFLLEMAEGARPDLGLSEGEFRDISWMEPSDLLAGIIEWKKEAYRQGFAALGINV